jgi:hypothetical protein
MKVPIENGTTKRCYAWLQISFQLAQAVGQNVTAPCTEWALVFLLMGHTRDFLLLSNVTYFE